MEKTIVELEKKLEASLKENELLEADNSALHRLMKKVMKEGEEEQQQLAEKFNEEKARFEDEICKLKLAVQDLSSAPKAACESTSDEQEDCDSVADPQEDGAGSAGQGLAEPEDQH